MPRGYGENNPLFSRKILDSSVQRNDRYRPIVDIGNLHGPEGNAFVILARVKRALKEAERDGELPKGTSELFLREAKSGDYNRLLKTVDRYCTVVQQKREYQVVSAYEAAQNDISFDDDIED